MATPFIRCTKETHPDFVICRKTVLVIDDEPSILRMRQAVLGAWGYTVLTADSGEEGLNLLRRNTVHAVILDYQMPGMDGEETACRIRGIQPELPIILSSACLVIPERVLALVNASVDKAQHPQVLIDVLRQQLEALPFRKTFIPAGFRQEVLEAGDRLATRQNSMPPLL